MTQTEALKLALEALEKLTNAAEGFSVSGVYFNEERWARKCLDDAYDAMGFAQEALAQPAIGEDTKAWVGLTDEDKKQIAKEANYNWEMTTGEYAERIGRLTEAKLKEKNNVSW